MGRFFVYLWLTFPFLYYFLSYLFPVCVSKQARKHMGSLMLIIPKNRLFFKLTPTTGNLISNLLFFSVFFLITVTNYPLTYWKLLIAIEAGLSDTPSLRSSLLSYLLLFIKSMSLLERNLTHGGFFPPSPWAQNQLRGSFSTCLSQRKPKCGVGRAVSEGWGLQ